MKNWRTVGFFAGVSSALVMFANLMSKHFGFEIESKVIEDVVMGICSVLVAFGVVSASVKPKGQTEVLDIEKEDCLEQIKEENALGIEEIAIEEVFQNQCEFETKKIDVDSDFCDEKQDEEIN